MTDFSTLASIAKPQMMGQAPSGAGNMAGILYAQDERRFNDFLAKAAEQAKIKAAAEAMQAEELALGAPGRRSKLNLANRQGALEEQDFEKHGEEDMAQKRAMKQLASAEKLLLALAQTSTDEEAKQIMDNSEFYGGSRVGNKDLKSLPMHVVRMLAKKYEQTTDLTRKNEAKLKQTELTAASRERIAKFTRKSVETIAEEARKLRRDLDSAHVAREQNKPLTPGQLEVLDLEKMFPDDPENRLLYRLMKQGASRLPSEIAKAETAQTIGVPATVPKPFVPPKPKVWPLPEREEDAVDNKIYKTKHGPARWDKAKKVLVPVDPSSVEE